VSATIVGHPTSLIPSDVLLMFLGPDDDTLAMTEVLEGIYGTHQSTPNMKWLLRRYGFYWLIKYYKSCHVYQKFDDFQLVPTAELHPIMKPCPFRGWGLDFVVEIYPLSLIRYLKSHCFKKHDT
jgi:hypothetical protein